MAVTEHTVRAELVQLFSGFPGFTDDEHRELFVEIGCFLANGHEPRLVGVFEQLEEQLQQAKRQRSQSSTTAPLSTWEKDKDSHLLTSTLTAFEQKQGGFKAVRDGSWWQFTQKERARLYLSFVRADRFRDLLSTGYHWKDPTVSPGHGEFTHRLQWYALIAAGVLTKADAVSVMSKCGLYVRNAPPLNKKNRQVPSTDLWEVLFDRDTQEPLNQELLYPSADSDQDFRNPNNLNTFLRNNARLPFLRTFLGARFTKREQQQDDESGQKKYVAKKRFGKAFDQLTEEEQIILYGIILDGQYGAQGEDMLSEVIEGRMGMDLTQTPDLSVIKSVISKQRHLPYK